MALAVALAILTGSDKIYMAPEYSGGGDGKNWLHVVAHLVIAVVVLPLIGWALSSLVMLVTKKVAPRAPEPQSQAPAGRVLGPRLSRSTSTPGISTTDPWSRPARARQPSTWSSSALASAGRLKS